MDVHSGDIHGSVRTSPDHKIIKEEDLRRYKHPILGIYPTWGVLVVMVWG